MNIEVWVYRTQKSDIYPEKKTTLGIEKQKAVRIPMEEKIFGYRESKKNTHGKKNLWV